ncbi:T7SS effector LXG polymorphic toxin [Listeria booriae]|uniref:T7SS effector LXG polymorphic toxin n=1 Tax=Listeria booriae TaxID=1552123 RepID=UPI001625DA88|nr:T7SS effector LXG polymorphic toxin [Listeria booriae]MBC2328033.1 hypothetical protein [Listeria booriae]
MARIDIAEIHNFVSVFIRESKRVQIELARRKQVISQFVADSDIQGEIGDQAKAYYRDVYYPLIEATKQSLLDAEEVLQRYVSDFQTQVDPSPNAKLDLARMYELQADMRKYENKIEDLKFQVNSTANSMAAIGKNIGLQLGLETAIGKFREEARILENYEQFEATHRNVLRDVLTQLYQVKQSLAQIESGVAFLPTSHLFQAKKIHLGTLAPKKPEKSAKTYDFDAYDKTLYGDYWVLSKNGVTDEDCAGATEAYNESLKNGSVKAQEDTIDFEAEYLKAAMEGYDLLTGESITDAQSFSIISGIIISGIALRGRGKLISATHLSKIKSDLKLKAAKDIEMKTFSKKLMATKPMNSPVPEKWIKKGGSISIDGKGIWSYTNKRGQTVKYPNGYPDFTEYSHPTVKPVTIKVATPKNPQADFKAANLEAKLDKNSVPPVPQLNQPPKGYTWHHHEDGKTMVLVEKGVHRDFTHIGGQSNVNGRNKQ